LEDQVEENKKVKQAQADMPAAAPKIRGLINQKKVGGHQSRASRTTNFF
jgi:hypothetical protein